jgi:hypothetical protein
MAHARTLSHAAVCTCAALCALALPACGDWRLFSARREAGNASLRTTSASQPVALTPAFRTAVYRATDGQAADVYLTDLPIERLTDLSDPLADASGSIVHIAMFVTPLAGRTPIDATACNASIRQFVLAGNGEPGAPPAVGVYGGGGFVIPGELGATRLDLAVRGATLRLVHATPAFSDVLGPSQMQGQVRAVYDPGAVNALSARVQQLSTQARAGQARAK